MNYLPIFIDLRGRRALVVGAGAVAARKIELLLSAGADVRVVAPEVGAAVRRLTRIQGIPLARRRYRASDLGGVALVVAATGDPAVNAAVAAAARARGLPVNVVDTPQLCSFIMPSILDRDPVLVAVSTQGTSPALARMVRRKLEDALPPRLGQLARFASEQRARVNERIVSEGRRSRFWERVLQGEIGRLVLSGKSHAAERALTAALARQRKR